MPKYRGMIGYAFESETSPGVWELNDPIEKMQFGDLITRSIQQQTGDSINDNIKLSNDISIIADKYSMENYDHMKYAIVNGTKWKVEKVDIRPPRLLLTIGGLYNG